MIWRRQLVWTVAMCSALAWGQVAKKKPTFEVVSIRPTAAGGMGGALRWAPDPDGYRTTGQSLWSTIMIAYYPEGFRSWIGRDDKLRGAESWVSKEFFDIDARVSASDVADWQKQTPLQNEMLRAMLRTMLEERCKLILRQTSVDTPILALQVSHSVKMKESVPGAAPPVDDVKLADGGMMVRSKHGDEGLLSFYGVTMASLAGFLSTSGSDRIVQDKTGLSSRYDFVLRKRDVMRDASNDLEPVLAWDLEALGLTLKAAKAATVVLVIDHIERPSAN